MEVTVPSGTVYPALGHLERDGLVTARWEDETVAFAGRRPARRYYRVDSRREQALVRLVENMRCSKKSPRRGGNGDASPCRSPFLSLPRSAMGGGAPDRPARPRTVAAEWLAETSASYAPPRGLW